MVCIYGIFGREITKHTVIYGADIRFWQTLLTIKHANAPMEFPTSVDPPSAPAVNSAMKSRSRSLHNSMLYCMVVGLDEAPNPNRSTAYTCKHAQINRVGQNRISAPYMTVFMVISLPKIPYIHYIYLLNVCLRSTLTNKHHSGLRVS